MSKIHDSSLTTTHSARSIGIIFDVHLTFSDQISALSKSCYTITFVNFAVPAHILILKHSAPSSPPLSILSSITVTLSITNFQTINLIGSNRSRTLLIVLLLRLLNPHIISPILKSLHWLKVNERIEYKLFSLTYKVLTTNQLNCLNNLISVQPPRSTRSSSVVTLSRPPTISSLKITATKEHSIQKQIIFKHADSAFPRLYCLTVLFK